MVGAFNWASFMLDVDSRANQLQKSRVTRTGDNRVCWVELVCCDEIADQIKWALQSRGVNPIPCDPSDEWTHKFRFDGPYRQWLANLLGLLERVLTVPSGRELDLLVALDWHSHPPDSDDPTGRWPKTPTGHLVNRKYWNDNPAKVAAAVQQLSDSLTEVVRTHPRYTRANAVLVVPGTTRRFGERLAREVAGRLGLPAIETTCIAADHSEAKAGHTSRHLEPYEIHGDVFGKDVIIVDDVYLSGRTIRGVAAAARAQAPFSVLGLVATRTHRSS